MIFPFLQGAIGDGADAVGDVVQGLVDAVAVGAFGNQIISIARVVGVAEDVVVAAAEVAAEGESDLAPGFLDVDDDNRRTQQVAGIQPGGGHTVCNGGGLVVGAIDWNCPRTAVVSAVV